LRSPIADIVEVDPIGLAGVGFPPMDQGRMRRAAAANDLSHLSAALLLGSIEYLVELPDQQVIGRREGRGRGRGH